MQNRANIGMKHHANEHHVAGHGRLLSIAKKLAKPRKV